MSKTTPQQLKARLRGVLAFPITPYRQDGAVDLEGVRKNAGWLVGTGLAAVVAPSGTGELYRLASRGDFAALGRFHQRVVRPFYELRQRRRGFEVAVIKAAMELLGHPAGPPRPPLGRLSPADRDDLGAILERLEVPTAAQRRAATRGALAVG